METRITEQGCRVDTTEDATGTHVVLSARYHCQCGWAGDHPSLSDASQEVLRDGVWVTDRTHVPLCPLCFRDVTSGSPSYPRVAVLRR